MKILFFILFISIGIQAQKFSASVNAGPAFPTGDFSELWNAGFEGNVLIGYKLQSNIDLILYTGYARWGFNNEGFNELQGSQVTFNLDVPLTSIPLLVGAKYYLGTDDIKPYTFIYAGVFFLEYTLSGSYTINNTKFNITPITEKETETGLAAGAGLLYRISPAINLDVNAKFNLINDTDAIKEAQNQGVAPGGAGATTSTYFSVSAGVQILF